MNPLKTVSREEYAAYIKNLEDYEDKPVEAIDLSCMQTISNGVLMAQAIYYRGGSVQYKIRV